MPTYSYFCDKCHSMFELYSSISEYVEHPECIYCDNTTTYREYLNDVKTQNFSVKKNDSELSTVGDLANRNRDKLSEDEKHNLYVKHNEYKQHNSNKPLPQGMSRIKRKKYD